jgi:acylpyruvate hydrolase
MQAAVSFVKQGKKIVGIGRNYAAHAKELNNAIPKEPFFFLKPTTSYIETGGTVEIPKGIIAHYEVELGLVIGRGGRDILQANADSHIAGYALAVDMTARNMQDEVKRKGLPWSAIKGFDTFTPVGHFIPKSSVADPHNLKLSLRVNGMIKQDGHTADMIFRIPRLIEHVSSIMTLEEGDLILTGTPSGIGPIKSGDMIECTLSNFPTGKELATLTFSAANREDGYTYPSPA